MGLDELTRKSYLSEDWYQGQTQKWDELSDKDWVFTRPQFVPGTVGIHMQRGRDSAEFRVDADLTREKINTRLLRLCEAYDFEVAR
jgi:hypothetical protein